LVEIVRLTKNSEDPEYDCGLTVWHARPRRLLLQLRLVHKVQGRCEYFDRHMMFALPRVAMPHYA
jgi:hypothetical protein